VPTPLWLYAAEIEQPASLTVDLLNQLAGEGEIREVGAEGSLEFVRDGERVHAASAGSS